MVQFKTLLCSAVCIVMTGCSNTYFNAMEALGHPKRELLVTRVEAARDSQKDAKEQFKSALEKFQSVTAFNGAKLETQYRTLDAEYERSKSEAERVTKRIESVKDVADALFDEWKSELKQYSNSHLRDQSRKELEETKLRYRPLIAQMERAREKMSPVLTAFYDQVLFMKHNLNARAIASLKGELKSIEGDVATLVKEMERAINEANEFVNAIEKSKA